MCAHYPHLNTYALQDSNLHFDIMNIKFYLLSQELDNILLTIFEAIFSNSVAQLNLRTIIFGKNCFLTGTFGPGAHGETFRSPCAHTGPIGPVT